MKAQAIDDRLPQRLKNRLKELEEAKKKAAAKKNAAAKKKAVTKKKAAPKKKKAPKKKVVYDPKKHTHPKKIPAPKRLTTKTKTAPKKKAAPKKKPAPGDKAVRANHWKGKEITPKFPPKTKTSFMRSLYDVDEDMNADLNALQIGTNKGVKHPSSNHAAATTKITCGVMGIFATAAAVGLYLYKKRSTTTKKRKNMEQEHAESVPDPMEIV